MQTTWRGTGGSLLHRGSVVYSRDESRTFARRTGQAVMIVAQSYAGGLPNLSELRDERVWSLKHVVTNSGARRPWRAGGELTSRALHDQHVVNPLGELQLERANDRRGVAVLRYGSPRLRHVSDTAAAFFEAPLVHQPRFSARTGLRADWQAGEGALLSPRASAFSAIGAFALEANAGLFSDSLTPGLSLEIARRAGAVQALILHGATVGAVDDYEAAEPLTLVVDKAFARRRDVVLQGGIRRRIGRVDLGVEEKWTRGLSLAGSTRTRTVIGLADVLNADRGLSRRQLHARVSVSGKPASVTAHYERVWTRDDTDGPFSLPAREGDIAGELGRSSGVPAHHMSVFASLALPAAIRTTATITGASGAPYSIVTGRNPDGLATFTDRGNRARNTGTLPSHVMVSLYASRRIDVPRTRGFGFDVGLQIENLLNRRNVVEVGRVVDTALYGKPVVALAGRSARISIELSR